MYFTLHFRAVFYLRMNFKFLFMGRFLIYLIVKNMDCNLCLTTSLYYCNQCLFKEIDLFSIFSFHCTREYWKMVSPFAYFCVASTIQSCSNSYRIGAVHWCTVRKLVQSRASAYRGAHGSDEFH